MDQERIDKITTSLNHIHVWPSKYTFKFILPTKSVEIEELIALFPKHDHISFRASKNGKYTSITITQIMYSASAILEKHQESSKINGIISL